MTSSSISHASLFNMISSSSNVFFRITVGIMGRRHLLYLLYTSSFRPSSTPYFTVPLPPPPPFSIRKGYIHESSKANHTDETIDHQRAPSTFDEFKRLEEDFKQHEEKMEEMTSHGVASQTIEKAAEGFQEAVTGNDNFESIKETIKDFKDDGGVRNPDQTTGHK